MFRLTKIFTIILIISNIFQNPPALEADEIILKPAQLKKYSKSKKNPPPDKLKVEVKLATVIQQNTVYHKFIKEKLFKALNRLSSGLLKLELVTGDKFTDEGEIIKKFRNKEYHGVGISGMWATELVPEFNLLGLPLLFDYEPDLFWNGKYTEIDYILERVETSLAKASTRQGYQFCGLAETCLYFLGTSNSIKNLKDLKSINYWVYPNDEARSRIGKSIKYQTVNEIAIKQVPGAFSDGIINSTPTSHKTLIHYNLSSYVNYISEYPLCGYECADVLFDKDVIKNIAHFVRRWGEKYGIKNRYRYRRNFLRIMDVYLSKKMRFLIRKEEAIARQHIFNDMNLTLNKIPEEELEKLRQKVEPLYKEVAAEKDAKKFFESILRYRDNYRRLKEYGKLTGKWFDNGIIPGGNHQDSWRY